MSIEGINRRVIRCVRCPELRAYCAQVAREKKRAYLDSSYWGKPVPSFGDPGAQILMVGLAPGAHGSNRTGRPFTGDASGSFLYPALHRAGFANQPTAVGRDDGLRLTNCLITAALRCAPPGNKPTPRQLANCFPYLVEEFEALAGLRVVIAFGAIAFKATLGVLRELGYVCEAPALFAHGAELHARNGTRTLDVIASFHPSRQNTNTGKLTREMFDRVFVRANQILNMKKAR